MSYPQRRTSGSRLSLGPLFLLVLIAAAAAGLGYVAFRMLTASAPQISLLSPFEKVGRGSTLAVQITDRHGLTSVEVVLEQGGQAHVLQSEKLDPPRGSFEVRWSPAKDTRLKLLEGPGHLRVRAHNASWGNFFRGRTATLEKDFAARLVPPRLEVLTAQHYVNQGGCDMVVYRVTPAGRPRSGVVVGDRFFQGFPAPGRHRARRGIRHLRAPLRRCRPPPPSGCAPATRRRTRALVGFWLKVFPKVFRTRTLQLDDAFLDKVVPEIMSQTPSLGDQGDLLKNYLAINRDLREANTGAGRADRAQSQPRVPVERALPAARGARRWRRSSPTTARYVYSGQEVDRQDHLGYDLATTAHAPVTAANDGVVALAEYLASTATPSSSTMATACSRSTAT